MSQRKINKAIYLILEKYHRLFGLKLVGFSGGHGYGYGMFYLDAVKPWQQGPLDTDYNFIVARDKKLSMVFYLEHVGLPEWSHGMQQEMVDWRSSRTNEIVEWLQSRLSIEDLIIQGNIYISRWRSSYTAESAEKYLFVMNTAGLFFAELNKPFTTLDANFSEYDCARPAKVSAIKAKLGVGRDDSIVWGANGVYFAENGLVQVGEDIIDIWQLHTQQRYSAFQTLEYLKSRSATGSANTSRQDGQGLSQTCLEDVPKPGCEMSKVLEYVDKYNSEIKGYEYGDAHGGYSAFLHDAETSFYKTGSAPKDAHSCLALIYLIYRRNRNAEMCSIEEHRTFIDALLASVKT